ncbi:MAG: hypothetical protein JO143_08905 [Acetobacteraceae bacterium]|nr:hypothetical protein [Acetobacteraceae bacterium]
MRSSLRPPRRYRRSRAHAPPPVHRSVSFRPIRQGFRPRFTSPRPLAAGARWRFAHPSFGTTQASLTELSAGERAHLGRVVEPAFAFVEAGLDRPELPTTDADTRAAVSGATDETVANVTAGPVLVGADAVNAAARAVDGLTRAVVGLANDGARVSGAVNGVGAVASGGRYGRRVGGRPARRRRVKRATSRESRPDPGRVRMRGFASKSGANPRSGARLTRCSPPR